MTLASCLVVLLVLTHIFTVAVSANPRQHIPTGSVDGGEGVLSSSPRRAPATSHNVHSTSQASLRPTHAPQHRKQSKLPSTPHSSKTPLKPLSRPRNTTSLLQEKPLKIAFCVTGQLARLELLSKIQNVFLPNARAGNTVHVFIYLDGEVDNVKQTYWNYNYTETVFGAYDRRDLKAFVDQQAQAAGYLRQIRTRTRIEPPPRYEFHVVGEVPVKAKVYSGHDGPKDNFEGADTRFQNNMRWMAGLRECVRWVQETELRYEMFYDVVVRLRDDTYAFGPWVLGATKYTGALVSSKTGTFEGINDHNFAVDRYWADDVFRGLSEDYYFNSSLQGAYWGNPEHRIFMIASAYNVPMRYTTICDQPLIPLRGVVNASYWRLHPLYIRHIQDDCEKTLVPGKKRKSSTEGGVVGEAVGGVSCCDPQWLHMVHSRVAPIYSMDIAGGGA